MQSSVSPCHKYSGLARSSACIEANLREQRDKHIYLQNGNSFKKVFIKDSKYKCVIRCDAECHVGDTQLLSQSPRPEKGIIMFAVHNVAGLWFLMRTFQKWATASFFCLPVLFVCRWGGCSPVWWVYDGRKWRDSKSWLPWQLSKWIGLHVDGQLTCWLR